MPGPTCTLGLISGWSLQRLVSHIWWRAPPQGTPPPSEPRVTTFFFFMEHIHMLPNMPTHLPHNQQLSISPYSGFPFHVLLQTSYAPSESGFQETGFLFTPCHTTREVFLLFLLNLEKEALDFHGSNISLFINNVWSHGP